MWWGICQNQTGRIEISAFQSMAASPQAPSVRDTDNGNGSGEHQHSTGVIRKDVPIEVMQAVPGESSNNISLSEAMAHLAGLQEVLLEEERTIYMATVAGPEVNSQETPDACFDSAVYVKALSCLAQDSATPVLSTCESLLESMRRRKRKLRSVISQLESDLHARNLLGRA
jgi:hypothetical protein